MTAVAQADRLDIHGFVRNEQDGSVTMDVEGPTGDLQELMRRVASAMSGRIQHTDLDKRPPLGAAGGFHIRHS